MNRIEEQKENDKIRKNQDILYLSKGIQSLSDKDVTKILNKIKNFNSFINENDPEQLHDFGIIEHNGEQIFWKIKKIYPDNTPYQKQLIIMTAAEVY